MPTPIRSRGYKKAWSAQLSIKFQMLISIKKKKKKTTTFWAQVSLEYHFLIINIKMPTSVGILTFINREISSSDELSMNFYITLGHVGPHQRLDVSDRVYCVSLVLSTETVININTVELQWHEH